MARRYSATPCHSLYPTPFSCYAFSSASFAEPFPSFLPFFRLFTLPDIRFFAAAYAAEDVATRRHHDAMPIATI